MCLWADFGEMGSCLIKPESSRGSAVVPYSSPPSKRSRFRLYGHQFCPLTLQIRIALHHKGLPVHYVLIDSQENVQDRHGHLLAASMLNPNCKLPILQHDGLNVCCSPHEILDYIESTFPKPSLRLSGSLAKHVQEWVGFVRDTVCPLISQVLYDGDPFSHQERVGLLLSAFAKLDNAIAKFGSKGQFFLGDQFSFVDVYLIPTLLFAHPLSYFRGVAISVAHPNLLNYSRRMMSFPNYAAVSMDLDLLQMSVAKTLAENPPPPLITMTLLQHHSMLAQLEKLVQFANELTLAAKQTARIVDPVKGSMDMQIRTLLKSYSHLLDFMLEHAQMEERIIFPALEKADRGLTRSANQSHARDLPVMNGIKEDLKAVLALDQGSPGRREALHAVAMRLRALQAHTLEHFREEETELLPLLKAAGVGSKQQASLVGKCVNIMESLHSQLFPCLLSGLQPHQIHQYLKCLEDGQTVSLKQIIGALKHSEDDYEFVWTVVKERLPALASSWNNAASELCDYPR